MEDHAVQKLHDPDVVAVHHRLRVSRSEAILLLSLYQARRPMSKYQLDESIPVSTNGWNNKRIDPDFRNPQTINVWIHNIRGKLGKDVINSRARSADGYELTPRGRTLVAAALELAALCEP